MGKGRSKITESKRNLNFPLKPSVSFVEVADLIAGLFPQAEATSLTSLLKTFFVPVNQVYSTDLFRRETGFH